MQSLVKNIIQSQVGLDLNISYSAILSLPITHRVIVIDGRPGLPSSQFMKVSQVEIAAIDPDFNRGYRLYP